MTYPAALPHDPIEQIADDLFMVRGCVRLNRLMRITRNMAVIRHGTELTLVNPIRLSEPGERALLALGEPRRIVRLGPMHGQDDLYYVERLGLELWTPGASETYPEPKANHTIGRDPLPLPGVDVIPLDGALQPEVALLVRRQPGVLLTCDAIQHYGDYRHNTRLARMMMPFIGFPKTTLVGPVWLKIMTPEGSSLESAFSRLLEQDFDALLAAHGSFLAHGAKDGVGAAVRRAFAPK